MSLDLVFGRPRYVPGDPIDLVFGATVSAPILPLEITGTITFGAPLISGIAVYDNRLPNSVSTLSRARHQVAAPAEVRARTPWAPPVRIDRAAPSTWPPSKTSCKSPLHKKAPGTPSPRPCSQAGATPAWTPRTWPS